MPDGVIYVAAGEDYLDLAVQSVRSLRAENPGLAADIFTNCVKTSADFDRVYPIPDGPTPKLASLPHSRFDRTLYLDCDTLVVAPFGDLFDLLNRFDLAVAHDVRRTSALIREGCDYETPYAFPQMNCGVLLYRRSDAVQGFLADWQARYVRAGRKRDQITFRDLIWESDLRFYVLPPEFNLRRVTMLDAWEPLDARPTIVHSHRLLQHLRGDPSRLRDVAAILEVEREAREAEWAGFPGAGRTAPGENPVKRFHMAEALAGAAALAGRTAYEAGIEIATDAVRHFIQTEVQAPEPEPQAGEAAWLPDEVRRKPAVEYSED